MTCQSRTICLENSRVLHCLGAARPHSRTVIEENAVVLAQPLGITFFHPVLAMSLFTGPIRRAWLAILRPNAPNLQIDGIFSGRFGGEAVVAIFELRLLRAKWEANNDCLLLFTSQAGHMKV